MPSSTSPSAPLPRQRIRSLFPPLLIGRYSPGPLNSLTDVPNVLVHTQSIHRPNTTSPSGTPSHAINTGLTTILPAKDWFDRGVTAGIHRLNGSGEMTGSHWLEETGNLASPIIVTGSLNVGAAYSGVYKYAIKHHADEHGLAEGFLLPVVAETYDGFCSDVGAMPVTEEMVVTGIEEASGARVEEGNSGGGTGMTAAGFKAGTGSASRILPGKGYTLGALVQANYGAQWDLHIGRVPVGKMMMEGEKRKNWEKNIRPEGEGEGGEKEKEIPVREKAPSKDGSIIVILATDAPLSAIQCQRLAKRATIGVARVGGWASNTSGDIFLAFSTGVRAARDPGVKWEVEVERTVEALEDQNLNALFECAADATEEAIYNALCMAETTEGPLGRKAFAMDLGRVRELLEKYYVRE